MFDTFLSIRINTVQGHIYTDSNRRRHPLSIFTLRKSKPRLTRRQVCRNRVPNSRRIDPFHIRPIITHLIILLRIIYLFSRSSRTHTKHIRPLLNLLHIIVRADCSIYRTMPDLHLGASATVALVHRACCVSPFLCSVDGLTVRAGTVPLIDSLSNEASCWDPRVEGCGDEHFRVAGGEDVAHHCSRRTSSHINPRRIDAVLGNGVCNHIRNGV
jgi:hypothetical protein